MCLSSHYFYIALLKTGMRLKSQSSLGMDQMKRRINASFVAPIFFRLLFYALTMTIVLRHQCVSIRHFVKMHLILLKF
jgi:hypothetical protein